MSKVEMARRLISTAASVLVNEARIPTSENASGPSTFNRENRSSASAPAGIESARQTIESSSVVLVIETHSSWRAHGGIVSVG